MTKLNPLDTNFTDGCIYNYSRKLSPEAFNYTYYYDCGDGKFTNATTVYDNLQVKEVSLFVPQLVNPQLNSLIGGNATLFNFTVWYFDADDNQPIYLNITIENSTEIIVSTFMTKVNPLDTNATDGILYYYNSTFEHGFYQFQINCSDLTHANSTGLILGLEVNPFYSVPLNPIIPAVPAALCDDGLQFAWNSLDCALGPVNYTLQISAYSDFSSLLIQAIDIEETPGITSICIIINVEGLKLAISLPKGQYYWRVGPTFGPFTGNWSATFTFTLTDKEELPPTPPPLDMMLIIIILILSIALGVSVALIALRKSKSKPITPIVKEESPKKEIHEEKTITYQKGKVKKRYFVKIGVMCSKCETPFLLLSNTLHIFKCTKCSNEEFKVAYRCNSCKQVHTISKEAYLASGKQEGFDCLSCNNTMVLVKDIVGQETNIEQIEFQTEIQIHPAPLVPKEEEIKGPPATLRTSIEQEKPKHDIHIGVVCSACHKPTMIRNLERDQYKCQYCMNETFYVAYRCEICDKINAISKRAFINGKEQFQLDCPDCNRKMELVKK
jgi:hypothetical protein